MIIAVDAGGSRTTAAVADANGRVLARAESGPGAIRPGRVHDAATAIYTAARDALQRARLSPPATTLIVGASGASDDQLRNSLTAELEGCGLATRLTVTTDAEIALAGAFAGGSGILFIAGTGSVAWARLPDGTTIRAGGLGPVLGDRGSGHAIGREALRCIGAAMELGVRLPLAYAILGALGVTTDALPRWSLGADVAAIAALAPVVLDAAAAGDGAAHAIVSQEARQLAALVTMLAAKFPGSHPPRIAWGGGLLSKRADYRQMVIDCLEEDLPGAVIAGDAVDALKGAVWIATSGA